MRKPSRFQAAVTGRAQPRLAGRLLVVSGSEHWGRSRLGHWFTVPDVDVRSVYEGIGEVLGRCGDLLPKDRRTYRITSVE
jgi:hypothetical protein